MLVCPAVRPDGCIQKLNVGFYAFVTVATFLKLGKIITTLDLSALTLLLVTSDLYLEHSSFCKTLWFMGFVRKWPCHLDFWSKSLFEWLVGKRQHSRPNLCLKFYRNLRNRFGASSSDIFWRQTTDRQTHIWNRARFCSFMELHRIANLTTNHAKRKRNGAKIVRLSARCGP